MLKALFDIQRVHVDGASLHYEVYYKEGASYVKVTAEKFPNRQAAGEYINELLESND